LIKITNLKFVFFIIELFLNQEQIEKIHDFEGKISLFLQQNIIILEECMESLAREKEYQSSRTNDERLYRICERSEQVLQRVNDIVIKDDALKENMRNLDSRIETVEEKQTEMLELLRNLSNAVSSVLDKITVDSRMAECLNRSSREASQPLNTTKLEEHQSRETNQEVILYYKINFNCFFSDS
jgi:hypothetical protein